MPTFWRVFIINGCWMLSKAFSACIEMIIWFLFLNLLMWHITLIDLHILKNPCIPGINPTWSWCMILLMCCWILFASILFRIFASMFILVYNFLFVWYLFLVLVSWWWWLSEWIWKHFSLCNFLGEFEKDGGVSSSLFDRIHLWGHLVLDFWLLEDF